MPRVIRVRVRVRLNPRPYPQGQGSGVRVRVRYEVCLAHKDDVALAVGGVQDLEDPRGSVRGRVKG